VRERERLAEAFRREARASKNAKDADLRAEKARARADRLRRENEALRLEKEKQFFLKRESKRVSATTFGTTVADEETRRLVDASTTTDDDAGTKRVRRANEDEDENENENEDENENASTIAALLAATTRERDEAFLELEATRETLASAMCAATDAQTESRRVAARLLDTETALRDVRDVTVPSLRGALAALRRDAALARDAFSATFAGRLFAATSRLASISALYEKAAAENKKLHFAIQDLKGSIRVFCRVRPAVPGMDDDCRQSPAVAATTERDLVVTRRERRGEDAKLTRRSFSFDRAFGPTASQAEVYEACGPLIRCVADGYNVCLLAYGQTGSGKTHTMSGPPRGRDEDADATESLGVNYRALDDVFRVVRARDAVAEHVVTVSVLEIYNEECRDLLAPRGGTKIDVAGFDAATNPERARNRRETNVPDNVPDAVARVARDAEDVFAVMCEGEANRSTGATAMNARSSRSHSVVIVRVRAVSRETGSHTRGALYLVDLAGSERVARSEASGDRLKEARHINKSLSALGDVVAALQEKRAHVPYRNSKLTTLLRSALGPNGKAALFAHVSPAPASADESVSTLAFAERAAAVELGKPKARVVESVFSSKASPNEESARSAARDLAEMRARLEASEQRARDAERKLLGSVGSVGILDVSRASAGTSHRPASRIPTLPVSATRGKSRREISCDDFRGLDARSSNEDASYFDEAIPNDAFSSDRVPYESARVSRDARERDDAELRRQAAAAAMSAAEATPPRRADGDARRNVSLSRERRSRSSSLDSENSHRVANPGSVSGAVPALSPLSALANASFADDTGSPGVSSTGSGAFRVAVTSADDARAAPAAEKSSSPRFENAAASAAASRWRSAYDSVAAAHETDSTRKKRSMYSRAAAAFGFAKKKPTARGRWQ